jgi:hypothetical protein
LFVGAEKLALVSPHHRSSHDRHDSIINLNIFDNGEVGVASWARVLVCLSNTENYSGEGEGRKTGVEIK